MVESTTHPESLDQQAGTLGKLAGLLVKLTRQEISLFKAEMSQSAGQMKANLPVLVMGVWFCHLALMACLGVGLVLLMTIMPLWAACLTVAVVSGSVGALMVKVGADKLTNSIHFERTPESLETNIEFLKERMAS